MSFKVSIKMFKTVTCLIYAYIAHNKKSIIYLMIKKDINFYKNNLKN